MYRNIVQRARLSGFGSTVADGIEPRAFRPFETCIYADVTLRPLPWLGITADIELYWKRVYNQPENVGQILDLLQSDYYSPRYIMVGSGYNTGANLTLRKEAGSLTASLSAGYGVARRKYPGFGSYTRGRTNPGISLLSATTLSTSRASPDAHTASSPTMRTSMPRPSAPCHFPPP